MVNTWVLVADSSKAQIYSTDSSTSPLEQYKTFSHDPSREHDRDITSDLPGRMISTGSGGHHAVSGRTDPKKHEADIFAHELSQYLDDARNRRDFDQLMVVAAPTFLGKLREQLSDETKKMITFELDKNLAQHNANDIRSHLPQFLHSTI